MTALRRGGEGLRALADRGGDRAGHSEAIALLNQQLADALDL
jgi:hypothetical protein